MSAQRVGDKLLRRIDRETGLHVLRAWSHGGYVMAFVDEQHRHGWWNKKDGSWGFHETPTHYLSCKELFR